MADRTDAPSRVEQHAVFYAVAYTSLLQAERLQKERADYRRAAAKKKGQAGKPQRQGGMAPDPDLLDFLGVNMAKEDRAASVSVVFSALTLEAFINHYAIANTRFAEEYFHRYVERIISPAKWLTFPWMIAGEALDAQVLGQVKKLFNDRNKLAHHRRTTRRPLRRRHASQAVQTVRKAVRELARFDSSVSTRWLGEVEDQPVT